MKDLTTNNTEYYVSKSATANDSKCYPTSNPKTVTHTSGGEGKVKDISKGILKQTLLSDWTLSVVVLTMDPMIEYRIAKIVGASHTLLKTATKKFISNAALQRTG